MNAKELTLRVVPLDDVLLHEQIEKSASNDSSSDSKKIIS